MVGSNALATVHATTVAPVLARLAEVDRVDELARRTAEGTGGTEAPRIGAHLLRTAGSGGPVAVAASFRDLVVGPERRLLVATAASLVAALLPGCVAAYPDALRIATQIRAGADAVWNLQAPDARRRMDIADLLSTVTAP
ncbi:MAG: hypothetical protein KF817_09865 [Phycisphaeraceae bacterium]|nr:hypothetical protein [Phycisphaeraceae bacterium]